MKFIQFFVFLVIATNPIFAQNKFGIELRGNNSVTYNSGRILGSVSYTRGIEVLKEENARHSSASIGLFYELNPKNFIKAHLGVHRNGRVIDLKTFSDNFGNVQIYKNFEESYEYLQFVPSYVYNISIGKLSVPLEVGISLNRNLNCCDFYYARVRKYNFDIRLSSGLNYLISDQFEIGTHLVFSHALHEYQMENLEGSYLPYQIGIGLNMTYFLN